MYYFYPPYKLIYFFSYIKKGVTDDDCISKLFCSLWGACMYCWDYWYHCTSPPHNTLFTLSVMVLCKKFTTASCEDEIEQVHRYNSHFMGRYSKYPHESQSACSYDDCSFLWFLNRLYYFFRCTISSSDLWNRCLCLYFDS